MPFVLLSTDLELVASCSGSKMSAAAADVPSEVQLLLLETGNGVDDALYTLMLPVHVDFRSSL